MKPEDRVRLEHMIEAGHFERSVYDCASVAVRPAAEFDVGTLPVEEIDMTQLAIDLPESAFSALRLAPHEFAAEMRLAAAVQWYAERRISQGKAAEIAGLSRAAFLDALRQRRVSALQVDADELEGELNDA